MASPNPAPAQTGRALAGLDAISPAVNTPKTVTPDDPQTIDDLRTNLDICRQIKVQLRQRCEAAEADIGPMRATIELYKAEISDKTAEIAALRRKVESLRKG
jgi:hypothetical protein